MNDGMTNKSYAIPADQSEVFSHQIKMAEDDVLQYSDTYDVVLLKK